MAAKVRAIAAISFERVVHFEFVPNRRQRISKIAFGGGFVLDARDERTTQYPHAQRCEARVKHDRDDEKARNRQAENLERPADLPQHDDERGRNEEDIDDPAREIDEQLNRQSAILGYSRVGIVDGMRNRAFLARPLLQPAFDEVGGEPEAPADLEAHAALQRGDRRDGGHGAEDRELKNALDDAGGLARLQRVEKAFAPAVYRERDKYVHDQAAEEAQ